MKPLIVANWKCNPLTKKEAIRIASKVKGKADIVICPPFPFIPLIKGVVGAQDCFFEEKGAFTGQVSASMIKSLGCKYVITGHSERRRMFNETDEVVNKKIKAALKQKLIPILCVGETKEQRDNNETERVVKKQLISSLDSVSASNLVVAYEPIWAIGTGVACDAEEAQKMRLLILRVLSEIYNISFARKVRILYGGSVNSKNSALYIKEAGMNGLLVGGASLDSKEFNLIIKSSI